MYCLQSDKDFQFELLRAFCLDQRQTGKREQAPCCCIACIYVSKQPVIDDAPCDVKFWLDPDGEI